MEMEQIVDRFVDHELTEVINTDTLKVFDFRKKDGNSHCYQRWIIDRGTLHVTGDNYAAIYKWNSTKITLEFLASCNLGYFMSKCLADKDGSTQQVFCQDHAQDFIKGLACERLYDSTDNDEVINKTPEEWNALSLDDKFELITPIICEELDIDDYDLELLFTVETHEDGNALLTDPHHEFMFGSDAWEYSNNLTIPTMTPKMHLTALREAYKYYPNAF